MWCEDAYTSLLVENKPGWLFLETFYKSYFHTPGFWPNDAHEYKQLNVSDVFEQNDTTHI